tara:strand:- start:13595 stop:14515 length:921 start_codon:yes stop_codon:yes gene_type:complete
MNIFLDNVDVRSSTGPNHFANKLVKNLTSLGHVFYQPGDIPDLHLAFIESVYGPLTGPDGKTIPLVQRLDGIYFDPTSNYMAENRKILNTYMAANGVIFQSNFSKELVTKYFGEHKNSTVIHNGADMDMIKNISPYSIEHREGYQKIWCCASHWRPFKRLDENIRYFLEFSGEKDLLLIAGKTEQVVKDSKIIYLGNLSVDKLLSVYKASDVLLHLGRYDNCPNVVVDARACGCDIVCSSVGGTKEVAGIGAIVIKDHWDYEPEEVNLCRALDFSKYYINDCEKPLDMLQVSDKYNNFFKEVTNEN